METEPSPQPRKDGSEPQVGNMYRLTNRLWIELPEGTMERARKSYLYFKNGGKGYRITDLEERVRELKP